MANGPYRRTYSIAHWPVWDDELNAAVRDFERAFKVAPDRMIASSKTHARIDLVANRKKAKLRHTSDGRTAQAHEFAEISSFAGAGYELEFLIGEHLPTGVVVLTFGGDPDGGGEPIPEEDTPAVAATRRMVRRRAG